DRADRAPPGRERAVRVPAPRRCSSAGWCTAAATTRPPCWRHWPLQSDQKPRRSLTMIAVTRPGDHLVDDEDVVHPAGHSVGPAGPGIFERVAVFIDSPHPGCDVADDLL